MAEQMWLREQSKLLRLAWLATVALAQSKSRLGNTKLHWHERKLEAVARAQIHEGCLYAMRSSEHESGEFRQARTGLQECDGCVHFGPTSSLALCDHCVVQHSAAILPSETEVS